LCHWLIDQLTSKPHIPDEQVTHIFFSLAAQTAPLITLVKRARPSALILPWSAIKEVAGIVQLSTITQPYLFENAIQANLNVMT
jgi:hypothetical protein